jgi:hypothetical protein
MKKRGHMLSLADTTLPGHRTVALGPDKKSSNSIAMRSTSMVALCPSLAALYNKSMTSARVSPRVLCPSTDRIRSSMCNRPLEGASKTR